MNKYEERILFLSEEKKRIDLEIESIKKKMEDEFVPIEEKTICRRCGKVITVTYSTYKEYNNRDSFLFLPDICSECRESMTKSTVEFNESQELKEEARIKELKTMPYKEYLKTPHWESLKARIKRKHNYRCQICGSIEKLNVHHNTYCRRGEEKDTDVLLLCEKCHCKHHNIKDGAK